MDTTNSKTIELHIAHVGKGGNTEDGQYFYSCVPNLTEITEKNTAIQFVVAEDSQVRFEITGLFHSDSFGQIGDFELGLNGHSVELTHANTHRSLTFFSIVACDKKGSVSINCDPQATNVPPGAQ